MALWPSEDRPVDKRVTEVFAAAFGSTTPAVATAPATFPVCGEYTDHYGGRVIMGLGDARVAVAVARRDIGGINLAYQRIDGTQTTDTVDAEELSTLWADHQPSIDETGATISHAPSAERLALRLAGLVQTMVHRQLLPRDTTAADIAVVSDIPGRGFGEYEAIEVALSLALLDDAEDLNDAPMRARLSEVCAQAADLFSPAAALRARYTAALRGTADHLAVIDYADGSVTQVSYPASPLAIYAVCGPAADIDDGENTRRSFLDEACRAFGSESLRSLPDAPTRVGDWIDALHKVHPDNDAPARADACRWITYYEQETERCGKASLLLRSRRMEALDQLLDDSRTTTAQLTGLPTQLAELALARGAAITRTVSAADVVAFVPSKRAENFAADLADDGLTVARLNPGSVAGLAEA